MLYTTEEAAVICGFLNAHLAQAGVERLYGNETPRFSAVS